MLVFCVVGLNDLAVRLWGVLSGCASVRLYIFIKISFLESLLTALCAAVFFDRYPAERLKECLRGTVKRLSLFRKTAAEKEMAGKERK